MPHRILHLSDTHIPATGTDEDGVDAVAVLDGLLHDLRHVVDIDLVIVTGDVADDGSVSGVQAVRDRIGAFAAARGVPHIYTTGNHDDRANFASVLGSGHLGADGGDICDPLQAHRDRRAAVSIINGLRVITLDTLVPGSVHGEVDDAQLSWLEMLLLERAPAGTVVAFHHPPIHIRSSPILKSVGLRDPDRLAAVIRGTDVRAVLCGHYHLQVSGQLGGTPVWVTPGVITRIDFTAPRHLERAVLGASATVIDLGEAEAPPVFHVVQSRSPQAGRQVYLVDAVSGADVDLEE